MISYGIRLPNDCASLLCPTNLSLAQSSLICQTRLSNSRTWVAAQVWSSDVTNSTGDDEAKRAQLKIASDSNYLEKSSVINDLHLTLGPHVPEALSTYTEDGNADPWSFR